jgi:CubicO group peptidase (beta-lactamase class C family)
MLVELWNPSRSRGENIVIRDPRRRINRWLKTCAALAMISTTQPTHSSANDVPDSLVNEMRTCLEAGMSAAIAEGLTTGGSAILATGDRILIRDGYGVSDLEKGTPFSPHSAVTLASVTKPIVATATARAVSLGLISFDDHVDTYLPEFGAVPTSNGGSPLPAPTIRQLLSHTGGILGNQHRDAWLQGVAGRAQSQGQAQPHEVNAAVVQALAADGYAYPPGTEFRYSGLGFNVVALILQQVTETDDYETALRQLLFEPLGTETLTFRPDDALIASMPTRYDLRTGMLQPVPPIRPRQGYGYLNAGANLVGAPDDLAKVVQLHLNNGHHGGKELIASQVLQQMYVRQPAALDRGIGFRVGMLMKDGTGAYLRHGGASGTQLWFDRETGIGGAILTQTPARQTQGLALRLQIEVINVARKAMGLDLVNAEDPNEAEN